MTTVNGLGSVRVAGWSDLLGDGRKCRQDKPMSWCKLHGSILQDYRYGMLPDSAKGHLLGILALACTTANKLPADPVWIGRMISAYEPVDLGLLLASGFIEHAEPGQVGSKVDPGWIESGSRLNAQPIQVESKSLPREREREEKREKREQRESERDKPCGAGATSSTPPDEKKHAFNAQSLALVQQWAACMSDASGGKWSPDEQAQRHHQGLADIDKKYPKTFRAAVKRQVELYRQGKVAGMGTGTKADGLKYLRGIARGIGKERPKTRKDKIQTDWSAMGGADVKGWTEHPTIAGALVNAKTGEVINEEGEAIGGEP